MLEEPTTPEKSCAAAENQDLQLWTLVADAIASAHIRTVGSAATREDRGRESAIPFLYAFLDYMRLALPDLPDVVLVAGDTSRGLSTETGGEVEVYQGSGATPQCQIGSTRILIDDQPGRDAAHGRMLRRFLDTVCERAAANSPGASETLEETMARGLADILTSPSGSGDEDEGEAPSTRDGSEAADSILDEIVGETHEHLARALRSADLPCALVTRCWTGGDASYRLLRYVATGSGRVTPDGMPLQLEEEPERAGWKLIVGQAFRTGLLQLGRISQDGSPCRLLCVPCHFGGVPWVVVCQPLGLDDTGLQQAYFTYRDSIPRLNDSVRTAAWSSLFEEMRRIFFATTRDSAGDAANLGDVMGRVWAPLTRVFPVPAPYLDEVRAGGETRKPTISFGTRTWRVGFSKSNNPFFPGSLPLNVGGEGSWGHLDEDTSLMRGFAEPAQAEVQADQARRNADLAENVYAIGHPLKHRLGRVRQAVDTELEALRAEPLVIEDALYHCHRARKFTSRVECTAMTMDLMANLCQHEGNLRRIKAGFLSASPYMLGERFRAILGDSRTAGELIAINEEDLAGLDQVQVRPFIQRMEGTSRLFDAFYDDILFELISNAARHADSAEIRVEVGLLAQEESAGAQTYITMSNPTLERVFDRVGLVPEKWSHWRTDRNGPKGGLRLLAVQLRMSGAGVLLARPHIRGDQWWFSLAVRLSGLSGEDSRAARGGRHE